MNLLPDIPEIDDYEELNIPVHIPWSKIHEFFICAICLNDYTDPYLTKCGHIFCELCIKECLNRKHLCPLCNSDASVNDIIKAHHLESLMHQIQIEKENVNSGYFSKMMNTATQKPILNPQETSNLSPIEQIFKKHVHKSLLLFEEYYSELQNTYNKRRGEYRQEYSTQVDELRAGLRVELRQNISGLEDIECDDINLIKQPSLIRSQSSIRTIERINEITIKYRNILAELKTKHEKSVKLLIDAYDSFMSQAAPSEFLLPINIHLKTRKFVFLVQAKKTDSISEFRQILADQIRDSGEKLISISEKPNFILIRPLERICNVIEQKFPAIEEKLDISDNKEHLLDESLTLAELKVEQGSEIVFTGDIVLLSDGPKLCFHDIYKKGTEQRVDYYRCIDCNLNWICSSCSKECHKNHDLVMFMPNHKPSYGCCYCWRKKRKCTIRDM